jgi:3alpha(or 20beta)-hydroxysteroid dehydrogenase
MQRYAGRVALVTGGASGIGRATVHRLVEEGATVVATDVAEEGLATTAKDAARPDAVITLTGDVRDPAFAPAAVAAALEHGRLDLLVNSAGILRFEHTHEVALESWRQILDVNLTGTFLGIQASVDAMIAAGGGSIINVSSVEGLRGAPWAHGYVASKWGVRGLAKSAALELAPHKIRVNSLHPGLIRTPMTEGIPEDMVKMPLGRAADPIEVATFVLFLASDESSYATGSEFVVDGGLTADVPHK